MKLVRSGFVAQEIEEICKEIGYNFDGIKTPNPNAKNDTYGIAYATLVVPLVLWPYVKRTNERVYRQFQLVGHHQTLELRYVLKRNIEAIRPL